MNTIRMIHAAALVTTCPSTSAREAPPLIHRITSSTDIMIAVKDQPKRIVERACEGMLRRRLNNSHGGGKRHHPSLEDGVIAPTESAMRTAASRFVLALIWVLPALSACSSQEDHMSDRSTEAPARVFSEADKVAARSLSISNNPLTAKAEGPYARALLCKNGMDLIAERLSAGSALSGEQLQAIEMASDYFDRQLQNLAKAEGKTESDVRNDLQALAEEVDPGDSGRVAIDCLRRLQDSA